MLKYLTKNQKAQIVIKHDHKTILCKFFAFFSGTISNDACVLVLEKDIDDSNAKPVTLPPPGITFNKGEAMTVSGWGTTSEGGSLSSHLKAVTVPYVEDEGKEYFEIFSLSINPTSNLFLENIIFILCLLK